MIVNNYSGYRPHWLAVDGQGDLFFEAGSSVDLAVVGSITISVSAAATTTALTASPSTSVAGQSVTFTAAVTPQAGSAVPTGSVQFEVDGADLGNPVPLNNSGTASLTLDSLGLGPHAVTAVYYERLGRLHRQHGERLDHGRGRDGVEHPVRHQQCPASGGSVTLQTTSSTAVSTAVQAVNAANPERPRDGHAGPRRGDHDPDHGIRRPEQRARST